MSPTPSLENGRFYGGVLGSSAANGLTLAETSYAPGFEVPPHEHSTPFFCVAVRGSFVEQFESERHELAAGSLFYHPGPGVHAERFGERGGRCFVAQMSTAWVKSIKARGVETPDRFLEKSGGREAWLATEAYHEFGRGDTASALSVEELLVAMLAEVTRTRHTLERRSPLWLRRATDMLETRYLEAISLTEVAAEVDMHPSHVARSFVRFHGCTVGEFVRRLRLDHARTLLSGPRGLADVALVTGFADQSHFTRSFKLRYGCTPGAYRTAIRG